MKKKCTRHWKRIRNATIEKRLFLNSLCYLVSKIIVTAAEKERIFHVFLWEHFWGNLFVLPATIQDFRTGVRERERTACSTERRRLERLWNSHICWGQKISIPPFSSAIPFIATWKRIKAAFEMIYSLGFYKKLLL